MWGMSNPFCWGRCNPKNHHAGVIFLKWGPYFPTKYGIDYDCFLPGSANVWNTWKFISSISLWLFVFIWGMSNLFQWGSWNKKKSLSRSHFCKIWSFQLWCDYPFPFSGKIQHRDSWKVQTVGTIVEAGGLLHQMNAKLPALRYLLLFWWHKYKCVLQNPNLSMITL